MSLQEAADSLGLHYMTVYRYVRQGRLAATRHGTTWQIRSHDLKALQKRTAKSARRGSARAEADRDGLERRMLAGDSAGAWWLVESQLGGGLDPSGILTELLVPALRSIGERWAVGTVSIAEEHQATAVAQRLVGRLGLQFGRRGKDRGTVALAAPSGDLHTLPVAIVADLLRWRGFGVLELGGNLPAAALGEAVATEPRLVAVGIVSTTRGMGAEVAAAAAAARSAVPEVPVFVGGAAIRSATQARRLGADCWTGVGTTAAVETVERLVGSPAARASRHVA
jgi:MerR family transcriptional regulator, light-induced transcriptional regulator